MALQREMDFFMVISQESSCGQLFVKTHIVTFAVLLSSLRTVRLRKIATTQMRRLCDRVGNPELSEKSLDDFVLIHRRSEMALLPKLSLLSNTFPVRRCHQTTLHATPEAAFRRSNHVGKVGAYSNSENRSFGLVPCSFFLQDEISTVFFLFQRCFIVGNTARHSHQRTPKTPSPSLQYNR